MGLFRLVLAFCVAFSHGLNIPIPAASADVAVQTFYLVSGFYMSLILTEKYSQTSSFLTNRVLRLYPAYVAVAAVTLLHSLVRWADGRSAADPGLIAYETHFDPLSIGAKIYLLLTNLLLVGQDAALFLKISDHGGALDFTTNFMTSNPMVVKFLLVPQAWSLSIELGFYVLAPWLVTRSMPVLAAVLAATVAARIGLAAIGLSYDPWTYRFFPVEVGMFVLGMLVYRSMSTRTAPIAVQRLATLVLIAVTLTLSLLPDGWITRVAFYAFCAWALPLAFQLTRVNRIDRYLGELSYPVYLTHLLVISVALYSGWSGARLAALITVLVLASSVLVHELVQRPVDRYRATRVH